MNRAISDMHIAIYCSSESWGGLEKNSVELATELKSLGIQVTVFGLNQSKLIFYAEQNGISTSCVKRNKRYADVFCALKLKHKFQAQRITHCIFRDPRDISVIAITHFFMTRLKVIYFQAMQISKPKLTVPHRLRFAQINAWVCTSNTLRNQVLQFTNLQEELVHVIPLFTKIPSEKHSNFENSNLDSSRKYIGCVGRLDGKKDQLTLLKAFNFIKDKIDWDLLLIGDATFQEGQAYGTELNKYVLENDLSERVIFLPYQEDIHSYYDKIQLFVLPSISETFGTVTIEAMAHGIPILGTNSGATPEILNQPDRLFEPRDSINLAQKIIDLIQNEKLRDEIGALNRKRYQSTYSEIIFRKNWTKLLTNL